MTERVKFSISPCPDSLDYQVNFTSGGEKGSWSHQKMDSEALQLMADTLSKHGFMPSNKHFRAILRVLNKTWFCVLIALIAYLLGYLKP